MIIRRDKPAARIVPEDVRRTVQDLRALRLKMEQRKGFKPLTDKEMREARNFGRP
jgi:hypothetical protein